MATSSWSMTASLVHVGSSTPVTRGHGEGQARRSGQGNSGSGHKSMVDGWVILIGWLPKVECVWPVRTRCWTHGYTKSSFDLAVLTITSGRVCWYEYQIESWKHQTQNTESMIRAMFDRTKPNERQSKKKQSLNSKNEQSNCHLIDKRSLNVNSRRRHVSHCLTILKSTSIDLGTGWILFSACYPITDPRLRH